MVSDFRPHESYQFFLQEVPELLQTLEAGLLDLQQDHSPTKMHSLMRAAHSIKGGAACVGLSQIQTLAHSLETVLKTCSRASLSVDLELESLMLQAFDCLKTPLMEEIHMGSSDDIAQAAVTNPIWRELEAKLSPRQSSNFLFAVDIEKGLQRLETILAQPADADILIALKAQLQIFRGLGELAQLPDFVASSERSLTALQQTPDQPRTIGESALAELRSLYAAQLDTQLDPQIPVADELDSAVAEWWDEYQASQYQANQYQTNQYQASESLIGNTPEPIDAGLVPSLPQALLPAAQRSLNVRSDGTRLELLSNLVSELATQDNRFRSQHEQQVETIESMAQCFNRVRQLTVSLNRWSQQWSPPLVPLPLSLSPLPNSQPPARSISAKRLRRLSSRSRSQEYLQTTAQAVVEEMAQLGEAIQDLLLLDQRMQHLDSKSKKR